MLVDRRDFLKRGLALGSVLALPRLAWAQGAKKEPGARTLVLVHLDGGNDGLNTVVPYTDPTYWMLRPGLALNRDQVRKIDEKVGLHPALAGLEQLWRDERLAIINGVGYPNPNYSHFRATEIYYTAEPDKTPNLGWLGRALDSKPSDKPLRAMAIGKEKPLALNAGSPGVVTFTNFQQFRLPGGLEETVAMYEEFQKMEGVRKELARKTLEALKVAEKIRRLRPTGGGMYGRLGQDLQKVAALLGSDLDLEMIQLRFGGFDTHANQAGAHNGLLAQVGNNLRAFQQHLDRNGLSDRVVTLVFSEFGRRPAENLSGGTDHGSAYPVFVIGKGIKPGLHGAYPSLEDLDRGNFKYTTDFRRVYSALLRDFLNIDPKPIVGDHKSLELLA